MEPGRLDPPVKTISIFHEKENLEDFSDNRSNICTHMYLLQIILILYSIFHIYNCLCPYYKDMSPVPSLPTLLTWGLDTSPLLGGGACPSHVQMTSPSPSHLWHHAYKSLRLTGIWVFCPSLTYWCPSLRIPGSGLVEATFPIPTNFTVGFTVKGGAKTITPRNPPPHSLFFCT